MYICGKRVAVVKCSVSEMFVASILSETLTSGTFPYCSVKLFENLVEDRTPQKNDLKKINNVAFSAFMVIFVCYGCLQILIRSTFINLYCIMFHLDSDF